MLPAAEVKMYLINYASFLVNFVLALLKHLFCIVGIFFLLFLAMLDLSIGILDAGSAEQEGIKVNPIELRQFVDFIKHNKLQTENFIIRSNQCKLELSCL